ncbi:MAG: peptidoglycan DD-metalloendopeptidase family protein [Elusimicrobia bacterium]|nr:peptidoglycan DD-metalloendopeptidase family protein [Elusimicrobiota bacterium]
MVLFLLTGAALVRPETDAVEGQRESLKKIQTELDDKRREKERADRRAREIRQEVNRISDELEGARQALQITDRRLTEAEKTRAQAESRLLASRQSLDQWEDRLNAALRDFYSRWSVAAEGSFALLGYEEAFLSERVTGLSFALENHRSVELLRDDLAEAENDLRRLKENKEREERRMESARERMRDLQQTTEGRQALLARQITQLNASARRFEKLIEGLIEKERLARVRAAKKPVVQGPSSVSLAAAQKWRGKIPWPIAGAVVEKFGRTKNSELDALTISNGIKIRPAAGVSVQAVAGGEVLFAGPFMNYGLMALVSHPDHLHTIYAQLGSLKVVRGQQLLGGEPVGEPGRDDQGRPLVYFELRVDGEPVDPDVWLH